MTQATPTYISSKITRGEILHTCITTAGPGMINTLPINSNGVSVAIWRINDLTHLHS